MPLQSTSGAASYDAFGGGVAAVPNYIEDVFSTYLYTGNGSTQSITNGIDLAGKGGMVWTKARSLGNPNVLVDTARGARYGLFSNTTNANIDYGSPSTGVVSFGSTGYPIGSDGSFNGSGATYASWTFRKQPKFFDVVTFTSNGSNTQAISHSLGSVPGCIILKRTDSTQNWIVWHRGDGTTDRYSFSLNNTSAANSSGSTFVSSGYINSTSFQPNRLEDYLGSFPVSGGTYVAYLFAHNAGGFGLTGTDNVISCGSFTTDGSGNASVTLGYEPQWMITKASSQAENWYINDVMRGYNAPSQGAVSGLSTNTSNAEAGTRAQFISSTGFTVVGGLSASQTYIYIAIRRGPMKVPTSGTSVFSPVTRTGTGSATTQTAGFPVDLFIPKPRNGGTAFTWSDRLRGDVFVQSANANAENYPAYTTFDNQTGVNLTSYFYPNNAASEPYVNYNFRRAPSTFDEVCYTGTEVAGQTFSHNLGAVPELMIIKRRDGATAWQVYTSYVGNTAKLVLNSINASTTDSTTWNDTSPTSSVFTVGTNATVNSNGNTYVAYLWATNAGVTKVGSFTGNGSSQTIDCGFTGGSRLILIKRTDSSGDWYVWDSARGIVSGNDPHLSLNTTAAEVTTDDTIDPDSTGFIVNQLAATNVNVTSATYIFLAIA